MKEITNFVCDLGSGKVNITISSSIYNIEAIHAATYHFTDAYHILILQNDDGTITIIFEAKNTKNNAYEDLKDFANILIDHQIRVQLEQRNSKIRDLIVRHAFSPFDLKKES